MNLELFNVIPRYALFQICTASVPACARSCDQFWDPARGSRNTYNFPASMLIEPLQVFFLLLVCPAYCLRL